MNRKVIKYIVCVIIILMLVSVCTLVVYNMNNKDYDSVDDLFRKKYLKRNITYMQSENYYYIINNGKSVFDDLLIYFEDGDNYTIYDWDYYEANYKSKHFYPINYNGFEAYLFVDESYDDFIIQICRLFVKNEVEVFDNYGDFESIKNTNDNLEYYFKVINKEEVIDDYEINVLLNGETKFLISGKELWASSYTNLYSDK